MLRYGFIVPLRQQAGSLMMCSRSMTLYRERVGARARAIVHAVGTSNDVHIRSSRLPNYRRLRPSTSPGHSAPILQAWPCITIGDYSNHLQQYQGAPTQLHPNSKVQAMWILLFCYVFEYTTTEVYHIYAFFRFVRWALCLAFSFFANSNNIRVKRPTKTGVAAMRCT